MNGPLYKPQTQEMEPQRSELLELPGGPQAWWRGKWRTPNPKGQRKVLKLLTAATELGSEPGTVERGEGIQPRVPKPPGPWGLCLPPPAGRGRSVPAGQGFSAGREHRSVPVQLPQATQREHPGLFTPWGSLGGLFCTVLGHSGPF